MKGLDVAKYIIYSYDRIYGQKISNLKLQKLLYYVQAYMLKNFSRVAFEDKIEHWPYGPVVPNVYFNYNHYRAKDIDEEYNELDINMEFITQVVIDKVVQATIDKSAVGLANMTHLEEPWINTSNNEEITPDAIQNYFKREDINPLEIKIC